MSVCNGLFFGGVFAISRVLVWAPNISNQLCRGLSRMITTQRVVDMFVGQNTWISSLREKDFEPTICLLNVFLVTRPAKSQNPKDLQKTSLTQWISPTHYLVKDHKCKFIATSYNFQSSFSKTTQQACCNPKNMDIAWVTHLQRWTTETCHWCVIRHQHFHPQTKWDLNALWRKPRCVFWVSARFRLRKSC